MVVLKNGLLLNGVLYAVLDLVRGLFRLEVYQTAGVLLIFKDMSRLGRDYLKVGFYTEVLFVEKGVRFIAINNGIDSANQQDSDFTPFLNIINEMFSLRMEAFVIQYSPRIYNKSVSPVLSARPQSAVRLSRFCQSAGEAFPGQGFPDCGTAG